VTVPPIVVETNLPYPLYKRGKVRDVYRFGEDKLIIVATDRISAFDHVLHPYLIRVKF